MLLWRVRWPLRWFSWRPKLPDAVVDFPRQPRTSNAELLRGVLDGYEVSTPTAFVDHSNRREELCLGDQPFRSLLCWSNRSVRLKCERVLLVVVEESVGEDEVVQLDVGDV